MHYISRFIAGFAIGFIRVWQISLVTLAIVPLIALAGGVYAYIATGLIARVRKSYVKAGEIAEEVLSLSYVVSFDHNGSSISYYICAVIFRLLGMLGQSKHLQGKKGR